MENHTLAKVAVTGAGNCSVDIPSNHPATFQTSETRHPSGTGNVHAARERPCGSCRQKSAYSWHHKSAYTHLQFCGLEHFSASPTDTWASVIMPLGIAHQSVQPQLLRFLQTLARFKFQPSALQDTSKRLTQSKSKSKSKSLGISGQTLAIFSAQAVQCAR